MAMKRAPVVECRDVHKVYNAGTPAQVNALCGIDLVVREGEFVAVQGASGSGKSTLLNCMGCLDVPTTGKVYIDGKDVSKLDEDELALVRRKKIGFVFQTFNIIPSLTALQNVELPMTFAGMRPTERARKAEDPLAKVGLGKRVHHRPNELSGGEVQRVAIARALVNDPKLVLADEPTGNIDSKTSAEIMGILRKLNSEGRTIVMITHDPAIARHAKRKIYIKDGKIVE
ncbi:MAG: ABC transporter ATP-binding protein [Candidatus Aenigmatarchaeota archaeon]